MIAVQQLWLISDFFRPYEILNDRSHSKILLTLSSRSYENSLKGKTDLLISDI